MAEPETTSSSDMYKSLSFMPKFLRSLSVSIVVLPISLGRTKSFPMTRAAPKPVPGPKNKDLLLKGLPSLIYLISDSSEEERLYPIDSQSFNK